MCFPTLEKKVESIESLEYRQLQLAGNPEMVEGLVNLKWKKELYSLKSVVKDETGSKGRQIVRLPSEPNSVTIPFNIWNRIHQSLADNDNTGLGVALKDAVMAEKQLEPNPPSLVSDPVAGKIIQKQTLEFTTSWAEGTTLKFQLTAGYDHGIRMPTMQLIYLTPDVRLCMEHTRTPSKCFAKPPLNTVRQEYKCLYDYQRTWLELLMMESAKGLVSARESVTISDVPVTFKLNEKSGLIAEFRLPSDFCSERLNFLSTWKDKGDEKSDEALKDVSRLDCICIQVKDTFFSHRSGIN